MVLRGPGWRGCDGVTVKYEILRRSGDAALGQPYVTWTVEVKVEQRGARWLFWRGFALLALLLCRPAVGRLVKRNRPISDMFCMVTNKSNIFVFDGKKLRLCYASVIGFFFLRQI